jgi:hypothetical protein
VIDLCFFSIFIICFFLFFFLCILNYFSPVPLTPDNYWEVCSPGEAKLISPQPATREQHNYQNINNNDTIQNNNENNNNNNKNDNHTIDLSLDCTPPSTVSTSTSRMIAPFVSSNGAVINSNPSLPPSRPTASIRDVINTANTTASISDYQPNSQELELEKQMNINPEDQLYGSGLE